MNNDVRMIWKARSITIVMCSHTQVGCSIASDKMSATPEQLIRRYQDLSTNRPGHGLIRNNWCLPNWTSLWLGTSWDVDWSCTRMPTTKLILFLELHHKKMQTENRCRWQSLEALERGTQTNGISSVHWMSYFQHGKECLRSSDLSLDLGSCVDEELDLDGVLNKADQSYRSNLEEFQSQ